MNRYYDKIMKKSIVLIVLAALIVHVFLLSGLRFTAWPEMLSYPYLRNNGYLLYKDMIHPYPPILTMVLSIVYKLFGYKLIVLKIFTWLIILVNDILIFLVAKKITKSVKYSVLSLISYILLQPFLEGNQLWFDLAVRRLRGAGLRRRRAAGRSVAPSDKPETNVLRRGSRRADRTPSAPA